MGLPKKLTEQQIKFANLLSRKNMMLHLDLTLQN